MAMVAMAGGPSAAVRSSCRAAQAWSPAAARPHFAALCPTPFTKLPSATGRGSRCRNQLIRTHNSSQQVGSTSSPPQQSKWPATAKVAAFTGAYITVFGAVALLAPQLVVAVLFPGSAPGLGWVRMGATLALMFGFYYLGAAADDVEGRKPLRMYQSTVLGRLLLALIFAALVAMRECGTGLLVLAVVNAAGAWRMHQALLSDGVAWKWGH